MIGLALTLDYEVYGTGAGDFDELMVEPTRRLLELADAHGARITIMAEVAEILALRQAPGFAGVVSRIEGQLQGAIANGHDVQLHLHPAWFKAQLGERGWQLDFGEYGLPALSAATISEYIVAGKAYLDSLGQAVRPDYRCSAFRAGNWLIQPSHPIVEVLASAGMRLDSTVFKWGRGRVGPFVVDFREAQSDLYSWPADPADINRSVPGGAVRELPIFTRRVPPWSMVTPHRLRLQRRLRSQSATNRHGRLAGDCVAGGRAIMRPRLLYPQKFDFCRLTLHQMKGFLRRASTRCSGVFPPVPVVAIGHSTEVGTGDRLERLLAHVGRHSGEISYLTLGDVAT